MNEILRTRTVSAALVLGIGLTACTTEYNKPDAEPKPRSISVNCVPEAGEKWSEIPIGRNTPRYSELFGVSDETLMATGIYGHAKCNAALEVESILSPNPPFISIKTRGSKCVAIGIPYEIPMPETSTDIYAVCLSRL